jgi:polar amino acid transport system permease protein
MAKWAPLIFTGFLFNLLVSVLAMALGTAMGVALGLAQVSLLRPVRGLAWLATQFFRNAPWLVLLFYAMLILPFEVQLFGLRVPLPGWLKSVIGLSLPVMANIAEIVRGGVRSIPLGQWESAEALAFSRRQILWSIILPQAAKRMIPPWMNLYAILTMATSLISIVGVQDGVSLTRAALVAEGRTELFMPMYLMLLLMFFAYCYPIARWTAALERRFAVKG